MAKNHPTFVDIKCPNQPTPDGWKQGDHQNSSIRVDLYHRDLVASFFTCEKIEAVRGKIKETVNLVLEQMISGGCEKPVNIVEKSCIFVPSLVSYSSKIKVSSFCSCTVISFGRSCITCLGFHQKTSDCWLKRMLFAPMKLRLRLLLPRLMSECQDINYLSFIWGLTCDQEIIRLYWGICG